MTAVSDSAAPSSPGSFRAWPRWGRWTVYGAAGVVLLLVVALVAGVTVVRQSFPQTDGDLSLDGLDGTVKVVRDDHGIPQMYAGTAHDLFFAQGFTQAQDRMYEMDVRRHTTAGRLSEMFGEATLEVDKTIRTMGWRRVAEQELSMLSPETQAYLQAYSDGVNAYIHAHTPSRDVAGVHRPRPEELRLQGRGLDARRTRSPGSRRWPGTCAATWTTRSSAA